MSFLTVVMDKDTGQLVFLNREGYIPNSAVDGVPLMVNRKNPYHMAPTSLSNGAEVIPLKSSHLLPDQRISRMSTGQIESFRNKIGFTDTEVVPDELTIALWVEYSEGEYKGHEFIVGGPDLALEVPLARLFGADQKFGTANTTVSIKQEVGGLRFRQGSNVTLWQPITEMFLGRISYPGPAIIWEEGSTVFTRFQDIFICNMKLKFVNPGFELLLLQTPTHLAGLLNWCWKL